MKALHLSIRNDVSEFTRVAAEVTSYLHANAVAVSPAYAVHLVVEELVRNVQRHAYGDARPDGVVYLTIETHPDRIEVHVRDDGPPFDPTRDAPAPPLDAPLEKRREGGLGLFLVREMADDVRYERSDGVNHVTVRIDPGG
jgi:anti-sigma regulatory factor (Ser/Thr protein kinase)